MSSIKINSYWNLFGSLFPMLVGILTIPFLIQNLGVEKFGVLSIIWALIGYFSIFDFGIGRALTHGVASKRAENSKISDYSFIRVGLNATLFSGVVGGVILALISKILAYNWLNASIGLRAELFESILYASIGIPFVTYTSGLKGIIEGYEKFKSINIIKSTLGLLNFLLPVLSVIFIGKSLTSIVIVLVIIRIFVFIWHIIILRRIIDLSEIFILGSNKDEKRDYSVYKFGAWMTLSNILSPLMVTADRFFISYLLGASVVAYYTVPFDLAIRALIIPAAFTTALFPKFAALCQISTADAKETYIESKAKTFYIMLFMSLLMILLSKLGLSLWINDSFAQKSWIILVIISIGVFFNGIAQVPHTLLQASGNVKITAIVHSIEFVIYIISLFVFLKLFGIVGAALTFLFRVLLDYLILNYFANKALNKV